MFKTLKFKTSETQNIWFTSDLHCYHNRQFVYEKRGFNSIEEHSEAILKSINDNVKENDILFNLGDWFLNCAPEMCKEWIRKINCRNIFYIWGNHCSQLKHLYYEAKNKLIYGHNSIEFDFIINEFGERLKDVEIYPITCENVTFLGNYQEIEINKKLVCLFHYPIGSFHHANLGAIHLTGHAHGSYTKSLPQTKDSGKILDVGWDIHKRPITWEEVKNIVASKPIYICDHHVPQKEYDKIVEKYSKPTPPEISDLLNKNFDNLI